MACANMRLRSVMLRPKKRRSLVKGWSSVRAPASVAGGVAMTKTTDRPLLTRVLATAALPVALMAAGSAGVHAEAVVVPQVSGSLDGANGANGVNPGDNGGPGGDGQSANADAGFSAPNGDPLNQATATGGNGGAGGSGVLPGNGGGGGSGGGATAAAATSIVSGTGEGERLFLWRKWRSRRLRLRRWQRRRRRRCVFQGAGVDCLRRGRSQRVFLWWKWRLVRRRLFRYLFSGRGRRGQQRRDGERIGQCVVVRHCVRRLKWRRGSRRRDR